MFSEHNVIAAIAVLMFAYSLIGLLAWSSQGESLWARFRRSMRRRRPDRDDPAH